MDRAIYFDHHILSPPSKEVIKKLAFFYEEKWGALSMPHQKGQELYSEMDTSQQDLYVSLGVGDSYTFSLTSGGIRGFFELFIHFYLEQTRENGKNHFLATEEFSIPLQQLHKLGCLSKVLSFNSKGILSLDFLSASLKPKTALVSCFLIHPLTGIIQPVEEIVRLCHEKEVKVHLDGSHAIGKIFLSLDQLEIDFFSFDGDKIHTPQRVGGLFSFSPSDIPTLTHDPASLSALTLAVKQLTQTQESTSIEVARLRTFFEEELLKALPDTILLFQDSPRAPHISVFSFPGIMSEALLYLLQQRSLYASIGGGEYPSLPYFLNQCGIALELSLSALSFSFSKEMTKELLEKALDILVSSVKQLKKLSFSK